MLILMDAAILSAQLNLFADEEIPRLAAAQAR
jgi:hypothetical protein